MGTFDFMALVHHIYTMSSRPISSKRFVPFRTSYFNDPWTLPSSTTSSEGQPDTGIISPNFVSHVGDGSTTSASYVEDQQPSTTIHARDTTLVAMSHTDITSLASANHTESM